MHLKISEMAAILSRGRGVDVNELIVFISSITTDTCWTHWGQEMAAILQTIFSIWFSWIKLVDNSCTLIQISHDCARRGLISKIPALILTIAWLRAGAKWCHNLLTHKYNIRPRLANCCWHMLPWWLTCYITYQIAFSQYGLDEVPARNSVDNHDYRGFMQLLCLKFSTKLHQDHSGHKQ